MDSSTLLPLISSFYTESVSKAKTPAERREAAQDFSLMLRGMMVSGMSAQNSVLDSLDASNESNNLFSTGASQDSLSGMMDLFGLGGVAQTGLSGMTLSQILSQSSDNSSSETTSLQNLIFPSTTDYSFGGSSGVSNSPIQDLYERILARRIEVENPVLPPFTIPAKKESPGAVEVVQGEHINQFEVEWQVGGDGANANCGPAALAMALRSLGVRVQGETALSTDGDVVDLARTSMVIDPERDGLTETGGRAEIEHSTYTYFPELVRGVLAAGAKGEYIPPSAVSIAEAINNGGAKVIVSGTFEDKDPLPWTGDSGIDNYIAPGGATEHYIVVTGYDPSSKLFTVQDPGRHSPHTITASTLEYFMSENPGALAVSRT